MYGINGRGQSGIDIAARYLDINKVRHPRMIQAIGIKVTIDEVISTLLVIATMGSHFILATLETMQSILFH